MHAILFILYKTNSINIPLAIVMCDQLSPMNQINFDEILS